MTPDTALGHDIHLHTPTTAEVFRAECIIGFIHKSIIDRDPKGLVDGMIDLIDLDTPVERAGTILIQSLSALGRMARADNTTQSLMEMARFTRTLCQMEPEACVPSTTIPRYTESSSRGYYIRFLEDAYQDLFERPVETKLSAAEKETLGDTKAWIAKRLLEIAPSDFNLSHLSKGREGLEHFVALHPPEPFEVTVPDTVELSHLPSFLGHRNAIRPMPAAEFIQRHRPGGF